MSLSTQPKNSNAELTPEPVPIKRWSGRSGKLRNAKKRYARELPTLAPEYRELGRDADRATDKTMTQKRRADRKNKKLAESLSDLSM
ncbi:uncharacterized protein EAF01_002686 [Botrytis porri]|nr:uncharacterized protein EAF01_002686 [Botrytis porri]KAF7911178.1 hypothetical protein EAF01_002686 [Botrytis porri]